MKTTKDQQIVASVIIPTYNRCKSLRRALKSLMKLNFPRNHYEVIVVDNNSNDDTPNIVEKFQNAGLEVKYVKEISLSFTVARHTGAKAASSPLLCYIDDDVTVDKNWMASIVDVFEKDESVGMVGGRIEPIFEVKPPGWALAAQSKFNGWSLWHYADVLCEAPGACGPNLCVRRALLEKIGGFPPDTIGVEAEGRPGTIEKIYIGPGDWGLSQKIQAAGYKVMYAPEAIVYHHIPPVRFTKRWWHSRLAGEGCCHAITRQHENCEGSAKLLMRFVRSLAGAARATIALTLDLLKGKSIERRKFWFSYYLSRARVELALARHPDLANRLWDIALTGVLPEDTNELLKLLP